MRRGAAWVAATFALSLPAAAHAEPAPLVLPPDSGQARGTAVLLHLGGWAGYDPYKQRDIMGFAGGAFSAQGFRVLSLDYASGKAGLDSVKAQIVSLLRNGAPRPLCIYGESAGAHLGLLAAGDMPDQVDCVAAAGAPVDFSLWQDSAREDYVNGRPTPQLGFATSARLHFGEVGPGTRAWEPIYEAGQVRADVRFVKQANDQVIPPEGYDAYQRKDPTALIETAMPGERTWLHGSISEAERRRVVFGEVARFFAAQREKLDAVKRAKATGCGGVEDSLQEAGATRFAAALACLLRTERRKGLKGIVHVTALDDVAKGVAGSGKAAPKGTARVEVTGRVLPARAWDALRTDPRVIAAMADRRSRRFGVGVELGARSQVGFVVRKAPLPKKKKRTRKR